MSNKNDISVITLTFEDVRPATTKENKRDGYVSYGKNNDYPLYLLGLYESSAKHGAIIRGKADFVSGKGFAFTSETSDAKKKGSLLEEANKDGETLEDVFDKVIIDVEIFEGAYLEVIFNKKQQIAEVRHLDFTKVRPSVDLETFYYSEDWVKCYSDGRFYENSKPTFEKIAAFNPNNRKGKQILFIRGYSPSSPIFPKPSYSGTMRYIGVDIAISEYHLAGISNGMFASKLISFNNGVPEEEEKDAIEKAVNEKFSGAKNAGRIMINFARSNENKPTIDDLSDTNLDKHFEILNKTVQQEIFTGHRITSPSIFGIKTEAVFAARAELRDAAELFQNTYVAKRQKLFSKFINLLLSINSTPKVHFQRSELIGVDFSESTISKVLTEDEIREKLGYKPKAQTQNTPTPPEEDPEKKSDFGAKLDDERDVKIFSKYGRSRADFEIVESKKIAYENDFEFYKNYFAGVATLSDDQKAVLTLIEKDARVTPEAIAAALKIDVKKVNSLLKSMEADGLIKSAIEKTGSDETTKREVTTSGRDGIGGGSNEATSIKIMYSYEGIKDDRNRPFCAKMLELDKLYSREDIEKISGELGYSVWHRRGGWYKPKGASEARPFCRHFWATNTVIEKKQKTK